MTKKKLINQLINSRKLSSNEEYEQFEDALIKLQGNVQADDIYELCNAFYDNTESEEVMFGLIHFIEQFPDNEYLRCIAMCSPNMKDAYNWSIILNMRILNNESSFETYLKIISDMENDYKTKILELLINIKNEDEVRFGKKVDYIIEKVGNL